jgi:hypothetical protein
MQKTILIILSGLIGGILLAAGLMLATYVGFTPIGKAFNDFFAMVGIIIFFISGFFLLSMRTLKK